MPMDKKNTIVDVNILNNNMIAPAMLRIYSIAPARSPPWKTPPTTASTTTGESDGEEAEDVGDPEAWATLNKGFRQVQSVLDRNRLLIQQVNENQQSRMHDNMVKNVSLIQELNGNISKVVSLYSDLNTNFTNVCQQRSKNSSK
ncbi:Protein EARLY FLOWERING 4 [Glycine soja]|uniref:Protein EARLY FLOWERING 4 n=1 Tax=Glycine soja TaxID=3848 RepID=A0A0B2RPG0_GLYSO|nr:Protein EARLY FLOWERING 4 [Glycine soja]